MKDYNFCFSWAIKTSDIIDFIQESNQIKVNNDNYGEIFENLSNYIKIDDVILNTSKHPFLFNFVKGAAFNPEKEFNTIFSEVIKKKDLADSFCEVKEKIHHGFKKFFKEAEKNLNDSLGERFENFNKNLHFIDYQDLINSSLEKFEKYNKDEPNFEELKQRFFEKNLNLICGDKYDIYFQIDLLKPLIASQNSKISEFSTNNIKNILHIDYDYPERILDFEIDEKTSMFPKFTLINPYTALGEAPSYLPRPSLIMLYLPENCEKLFSMFFEHSLETDQNLCLIHTEFKLEILFEYLTKKGLKTNDDLISFLDSKTYQELYKDYSLFFDKRFDQRDERKHHLNFIESHFDCENFTFKKLMNDYLTGSFDSIDFKNPMHLIDFDGKIMTNGILNCEELKDSTWNTDVKKIKKMSEKNDIFEQIRTGLSFI